MPELPEVETLVRGLRLLVVGRSIVDYHARQPKAINLPIDTLRERGRQKVRAADRLGKSAVLRLESDDLWVHLGLEGKVLYLAAGAVTPATEPMVSITFDDGARFRLERTFMGHVHLLDDGASKKRSESLGVDPLHTVEPAALVALAARKPNLGVKAALVDQVLFAGVGNVYSDEALHRARLHPGRKLGSIPVDQLAGLWEAVRAVLGDAVEGGGDESYADLFGKQGAYTSVVHGRKECACCGGPTTKLALAGRGAYFCPACQGER